MVLLPDADAVALTDSVLSMMEGLLPEYGVFGSVRQPTGSRIPTAAPTSAYPCSDGKWVLVAANSEPLFAKLAALMGQPDLPRDPRFVNNPSRVKHVEELDCIIGNWTKGLTAEEADRRLTEADIPCTLIYTAAEIAADPQFRERGMVRDVEGGPSVRKGSPSRCRAACAGRSRRHPLARPAPRRPQRRDHGRGARPETGGD